MLSLFGIHFGATARDAIIKLTAEISGHEVFKDELKQELSKLGLDVDAPIDRQKIVQAVKLVDLRHFGWDLVDGSAHAFDIVLEEMIPGNDETTTWHDFLKVCDHRLGVQKLTFSELVDQVEQLDEAILQSVVLEDTCFADYLFPKGLPQRPAPTESDPYATELDMGGLNAGKIRVACLDSHLPSESLRSLIVRSQLRVDRQLNQMDVTALKALATKYLVSAEIIEASGTSTEALHDEIDRQTREMTYEVFKAVWMRQLQLVAGPKGSNVFFETENPIGEEAKQVGDAKAI